VRDSVQVGKRGRRAMLILGAMAARCGVCTLVCRAEANEPHSAHGVPHASALGGNGATVTESGFLRDVHTDETREVVQC
jgi:hypothetical protein